MAIKRYEISTRANTVRFYLDPSAEDAGQLLAVLKKNDIKAVSGGNVGERAFEIEASKIGILLNEGIDGIDENTERKILDTLSLESQANGGLRNLRLDGHRGELFTSLADK